MTGANWQRRGRAPVKCRGGQSSSGSSFLPAAERFSSMIEEKNKGRHPLFGEKMDKEERRKVDTQGGR
jgi:hypothetical protein